MDKVILDWQIVVDDADSQKAIDGFTLAIEKGRKSIKATQLEIKNLEKTNKELAKQVKAGTITQEQADKQTEENNKRIKELTVSVGRQKDGVSELNKERREAVKVSKIQANSLEALRKETSLLTKERDQLNLLTEEGIQRFDELTVKIKENNDEIKQADTEAGNFKTSIGGYTDAIKEAFSGTNLFSGSVANAKGEAQSIIPALKGVQANIVANTASLGVFRTALLSTGIGAIVVALGSLVAFLTKTQQGADFVSQAMTVVGTVLERVLGIAINVGKALFSLITLDFDGLSDSLSDIGDQVTSLTKGFSDLIDEALGLAALQRQIRNLNIELTSAIPKLEAEAELLERIADDATRSFAERENAARKAGDAREQAIQKEIELQEQLNLQLGFEGAQRAQNGTLDDAFRQRVADNLAKTFELESKLQIARIDNGKVLSELRQDRLERDLDFEIDISDRRAQIILKQSEDEKLAIEERSELNNEAEQILNDSFIRQIGIINQFTDEQINANDLINESNEAVLIEKVRQLGLSEIIEGRLLEVIRDRLQANQDLKDSEASVTEAVKESKARQLQAEIDFATAQAQQADLFLEREREIELRRLEGTAELFEKRREFAQEDFNLQLERIQEQDEIIRENEELTEEERQARLEENNVLRLESQRELSDELISIREDEAQRTKEIEQASIDFVKQSINTLFTLTANSNKRQEQEINKSFDRRQRNLRSDLAEGIITQEEFNKRSQELEEQQAREVFRVQLAQFKADRDAKLIGVGINTASAVAKSIEASPITFGLPFSAFALAQGIVQSAAISGAPEPQPPSFAQGGDVFSVIKGKSHSQGGINFRSDAGHSFQMEGNEGLFITKKTATNEALQAISNINVGHGGRSFFSEPARYLQDGGRVDVSTATIDSASLSELNKLLKNTLKNVKFAVSVEDVQIGLTEFNETINQGAVE